MGFVYSEGLLLGISAKIFSYLELFLSNVGSQMLVFVLLIFSGTYGTFVFTYKISKNKTAAVLAGLFYFLNLYCMSQVFRRALVVGMFAWAYLPIYSYFFISWIEESKVKYLLYYVLFNFIFLWSFANPAYIFSFVGVSIIFLVYILIVQKDFRTRFKIILLTTVFTFITLIINVWWLYPYISSIKSTSLSISLLRQDGGTTCSWFCVCVTSNPSFARIPVAFCGSRLMPR